MFILLSIIGQKWTKYVRGYNAGTGGQLGSTTPLKVWLRVLVCCATAISKTCFTKKQEKVSNFCFKQLNLETSAI